MTLAIIGTFLLLLIIVASMYVVGLFNAKIAGRVNLILFTIANLRPNRQNARKIPKHLIQLAKIIIFRRKLFANKLKMKRMLKEIAKQKPRPS